MPTCCALPHREALTYRAGTQLADGKDGCIPLSPYCCCIIFFFFSLIVFLFFLCSVAHRSSRQSRPRHDHIDSIYPPFLSPRPLAPPPPNLPLTSLCRPENCRINSLRGHYASTDPQQDSMKPIKYHLHSSSISRLPDCFSLLMNFNIYIMKSYFRAWHPSSVSLLLGTQVDTKVEPEPRTLHIFFLAKIWYYV